MNKLLEILWLVIGLFCLGYGINRTITLGFNFSYPLFIMSLVAFIMFYYRRFLRKNKK